MSIEDVRDKFRNALETEKKTEQSHKTSSVPYITISLIVTVAIILCFHYLNKPDLPLSNTDTEFNSMKNIMDEEDKDPLFQKF
tara:strand:+ start:3246 stop:3494 length:249 start_codon:yes stop_codon:yes gene_type:complete